MTDDVRDVIELYDRSLTLQALCPPHVTRGDPWRMSSK